MQATESTNKYIVAAFYEFANFPQCEKIQPELKEFMIERDVKGTILVSPEGVNGTITGSRQSVDEVLAYLRDIPGFEEMEHKEALFEKHGFERTKVKRKKELIGLGVHANPCDIAGQYVDSEQWNELIERGVPMVDTRNDYEVEMGTFEGAIDPKTKRFKELPEWTKANLDPEKQGEVAMFCTGGIRCEKYSSYLRAQGFDKVYHLKGGVLKYLEDMPKDRSKWKGECYVFDERIAVDHDLNPSGDAEMCPACGGPIWTKHRAEKAYIKGVQCPRCA